MPRPVTPGVFVEESPLAPKAITGLSTTTAAFVGPTRIGPTRSIPKPLTSYAEFEQKYGGADDFGFKPSFNFIAQAVRVFFNEGGTRLYVARVGGTKSTPTLAAYHAALGLLAKLPDISIVAAPGHTEFPAPLADGVAAALVAHAGQLRYRIAVLDVPAGRTVADAQAYRTKFDSSSAALYYPWVVIANPAPPAVAPVLPAELTLPPSPFICAIYVRTALARGVSQTPANELVQTALRLANAVTAADQEILNPLGVNCLRFFPGRGNLVWGARTMSSDPAWKYVSVSRYITYLEHSIVQGTQWAGFEPNAEPLWARVRLAVGNFLFNEWRSAALLGSKPEEAYFVKCDRTTMSQSDLDHGRLVCVIGIAALRPAEFVIFRIDQQTPHHPP